MYSLLLPLHSLLRWLLLLFLVSAIVCAWRGYSQHRTFSRTVNALRHWTATIGHTQLVAGMLLYIRSPVVSYWRNGADGREPAFFGFVHISLMILAVIVLTIGSSLSKRKTDSHARYRVMLFWFSAALLIILLAIPWPFAPWAHRPYFRPF